MKKYSILVTRTSGCYFDVIANSEAEAIDMAFAEAANTDWSCESAEYEAVECSEQGEA
jgi:hypothetical protein